MSSLQALASSENTGRRKHLGELALVFRHRHGTWADFGHFLRALFRDTSEQPLEGAPVMRDCGCRHTSGGVHYPVLQAVAANPLLYPMFDNERYTRPCISIGAFEDKKNPGLVMDDVCQKASKFLKSIGKGDPDEPSGRDFGYVPLDDENEPDFVAVDSQLMEGISSSNIVTSIRERGLPVTLDDGEFEDSLFEDEDVLTEINTLIEAIDGDLSFSNEGTMETPSGYSESQDSVIQSGTRTSTKIRAATLGYLWQFATQPSKLREQFRVLRNDPSMHVLHLCGCGICYKRDGGVRVYGCVEKMHLKLGTADLNSVHTAYHQILSFSGASNYARMCEANHANGPTGEGVF
jgi:hypothetical protein